MPGFTRRLVHRLALCAVTAALGLPVAAQAAPDLPGGVRLGMSLEQLREAVPDATALRHPVHMAGGLVGSLAGPPLQLAHVAFVPTYFFANGLLSRIEYVAHGADAASAFDAVAGWCTAQWGPMLRADEPEGAYATWSADDAGIYLQETAQAGPLLRLVIRLRAARDASAL